MNAESCFEVITVEALLDRARRLRAAGCRLVQVGAVRLPEQVEITYSFEKDAQLTNLRLFLPAADARIPSISSVYACVVLYENEIHDLFNVQVEGMTLDFKGNLYRTAVKFPFGTVKAPAVKAAPSSSAPPVEPATVSAPK